MRKLLSDHSQRLMQCSQMLYWLARCKRDHWHQLHLTISHEAARTCHEKLISRPRFPWPADPLQHVHKYATPLHAMASATVQSRPPDGQDDDDSGLDDAVWDALQDSDEVCRTLCITPPTMWVALTRHGQYAGASVCSDVLHTHACCFHLQEQDSPQSKRSRHSLDNGGHEDRTPSGIASLPSELLLRVLSFLSAEDLTASVAPSCRAFKAAADDATAWRPLFAIRWGGTQGTSSSNMDSLSWKVGLTKCQLPSTLACPWCHALPRLVTNLGRCTDICRPATWSGIAWSLRRSGAASGRPCSSITCRWSRVAERVVKQNAVLCVAMRMVFML